MLAFKCCYIGFLESEFTRFRLEGSVASYQLALPTWTSKLHPYAVWLGCTDIDEQQFYSPKLKHRVLRWSLFSRIPSHLICQTIQFKKHQISRRFSLVTRISGGKA